MANKKYRGTSVEVRNDDFHRALRLWSKKVDEFGILRELRERMFYEKPADMKQRKKKMARKRWERHIEHQIENGAWLRGRKY